MSTTVTLVDAINSDIQNSKLHIPSMPKSIQRLQAMLNDASADVSRVSAAISDDPAIAGKVMSFANSPFIRPTVPISNIEGAIARMGVPYTISLSYGAAVEMAFATQSPDIQRLARTVWHLATQSAFATGILCSLVGQRTFADEALLALFHNIGALAILRHVDRLYCEFDFETLKLSLSQSHAEATRLVAESWNLPAGIKQGLAGVCAATASTEKPIILVRSAIGMTLSRTPDLPYNYSPSYTVSELSGVVPDGDSLDELVQRANERFLSEASPF